MPLSLDRLIYVDDSGHPRSGLVVYGWIEFHPSRWSSILRTWLDLRKRHWREYKIPITQELHGTEFVNGRGRISTDVPREFTNNGVELWKELGRQVALECLETIRCTEGLAVGAVYSFGSPAHLAETRTTTYTKLVASLEQRQSQSQSLAMIIMDGNGSDTTYREIHRNLDLDSRYLIEDALQVESKDSHFIQMADLVAWTANAYIDQHAKNKFVRVWYLRFLTERDPRREPKPV